MVELRNLFKGSFLWRKKAAEMARRQLDTIFPNNGIDVNKELSELSIAQQQMVEIARAFSDPNLKLLILDEPTRGIDVGAKYEIYNIINDLAKAGKAIIFISSEMPELIGMCDRIYVLNRGEVVGELQHNELSQEKIMKCIVTHSGKGNE